MSNKASILYIEDNPDNQRLVRRVLEARGYDVRIADDGPGGLATARATRPALILVDINIPGLDGHETTTRLRSFDHLRQTPIVALTADSRTVTRERSLAAGCDGYIVKPIDVRGLPQQIDEFIAGRREALPEGAEAGVLRDYTQKLVEHLERQVQEAKTAHAELQALDRHKSQFLAMLSHELRTPLTAILGYADVIERGTLGALTEPQSEAIQIVSRNAQLLARRLNSLLYLQEVRSSQLKRVPLDVAALLQRAIREYQRHADVKGITIQLQLAPTNYRGDALALDQAFRQLIDNAVKFTPQDGKVRVTVADEAERVVVWVQDTGCGIPAEAHAKIFQPFYQLDTSLTQIDAGVGIGLAIVKHAIEAHGGEVLVNSRPGAGSVFTVLLPHRDNG